MLLDKYRNRWGQRTQIHVPVSIVQDRLILSPSATAVFFVLLQIAKPRNETAVRISRSKLIERTGYSKNIVVEALRELEKAKYIARSQSHRKYKEFSVNQYTLLNPRTEEPLAEVLGKGKSLLVRNSMPYFTVPKCFVQADTLTHRWSISKCSSSEIAVYTCLCWSANKHRSNEFTIPRYDIRYLSALATNTAFDKALAGLLGKGLIRIDAVVEDRDEEIPVVLCDPYTGLPVPEQRGDSEWDLQNYFTTDKGIARHTNFNFERTPEFMGRLFEHLGKEFRHEVSSGKDNYKIQCIYHPDTRPSLSISPDGLGYFQCFSCNQTGTLSDIVMHIAGLSSRTEALQYMTSLNGAKSRYIDPDSKFEAIYNYRDRKGNLKKQTLRKRDANGEKCFVQRRPAGSGWRWQLDGDPELVMLYNLDTLQFVNTAAIFEGEKDCDNFNKLHLHGPSPCPELNLNGNEIVATTSGGAGSWHDHLADDLVGKKIILCPDNDVAGEHYADQIAASLTKRGIEFRRISFAPEAVSDVSAYLETHTADDLIAKVGADWFYAKYEPEYIEA